MPVTESQTPGNRAYVSYLRFLLANAQTPKERDARGWLELPDRVRLAWEMAANAVKDFNFSALEELQHLRESAEERGSEHIFELRQAQLNCEQHRLNMVEAQRHAERVKRELALAQERIEKLTSEWKQYHNTEIAAVKDYNSRALSRKNSVIKDLRGKVLTLQDHVFRLTEVRYKRDCAQADVLRRYGTETDEPYQFGNEEDPVIQ